jgi:hypothetical protein
MSVISHGNYKYAQQFQKYYYNIKVKFFPKKVQINISSTIICIYSMEVRINDNIFNVKTLVDKESKSIGMMGRTFDNTFDGLLFLMGGDKQSFWMKNCIINLDIIIK